MPGHFHTIVAWCSLWRWLLVCNMVRLLQFDGLWGGKVRDAQVYIVWAYTFHGCRGWSKQQPQEKTRRKELSLRCYWNPLSCEAQGALYAVYTLYTSSGSVAAGLAQLRQI
ncbi:hypothetical protein JB92DRAFT_2838510 [Gautieria morchelliformis]|nr:hypothetical protein JB92DRAFT_2838510 [Gautieria morchelliformis]